MRKERCRVECIAAGESDEGGDTWVREGVQEETGS